MDRRGKKRLKAPTSGRLADPDAERIRRNQDERIGEIQSVPILQGRLFTDIELEDGVNTPIPHGLGRRAHVFISPAQFSSAATTGRIREVRSTVFDPTKYVVLRANGWGETITVDAWVF